MTKKALIGFICAVVLFVVLMTVATFFDLEISVAIGNAGSVFGQFFNYLGEIPAWAGIPVAALILFRACKGHKYEKYLKWVYLVCTYAGFFLLADYLMEEMTAAIKWKYLYVALFGLAMTGFSVLGIKKVDDEIFKRLVIFALFTLLVIGVSQALVTALKYMWGRQRFRNLQIGNVSDGTDVGFTPWYKPTFGKHDPDALYSDSLGGKSDSGAYMSFPSGHSAAAAASFVIIMLPELFEKLKKYSAIFYAVPTVYTVLVMLSRIVNRAHFLSDVTVGAYITVGLAFLFKFLLKKLWIKRRLPYYEVFLEEDSSIEESVIKVTVESDEQVSL